MEENYNWEDETALKQGCWQKFIFFLRHSWRDVTRHKCHFCLAFCSVFIVVLTTLIVTTVVVQGPLIFVNLVQVDTGEIDAWYSAQNCCSGETTSCPQEMNNFIDQARGFNYTQIKALYSNEFNLSPRMHLETAYNDYKVYFIDLEQEKGINVGVDWSYPDMAPNECVLTQNMHEDGYEVGQVAQFQAHYDFLWVATATIYNDFVKSPADPGYEYWKTFVEDDYTIIECTIVGFISSGEGKFPSNGFENQIIINDFKNYLPRLYEKSYFVNESSLPEGWADYIMDTPDISSQYANILVSTLPGRRYSYYADANFNNIQKNVLDELSKLDRALGFYNIASQPYLL